MFREYLNYDSDKELISSLREGRQEAFSLLYDQYAPVLLGVITKIIGDKDLAEEVFQACFVKVWNQIGSYDADRGSLAFWLLSTARKVALDACETGRGKSSLSIGETSGLVTGEAEINQNGKEKGGMPEHSPSVGPREKMVFNLIYWKGYSCAEAAEELGMPIEKIKASFRLEIKNLGTGPKA